MNKSRAPQTAQTDIQAARIGAWEGLRSAKHSLALLRPGTVLGNWLQAQLRRRPPGATGTRGKECLKERGQVLLTPRELLAPDIPDAPVEPGSLVKLPLLAAPPPGACDRRVAAFLSAPYMAWQGGSHASRAAGLEGSLGKGRTAGKKGRGSKAETGDRCGGGFWGHGRRQRLEEPSARHRALELHSCASERVAEEGTGARGRGASTSEARELRVPALHRSPGAGRHDGAAACAPCAWSPEPSLGGTGAAGVPPSSPTLLFRRWVRKVESLISQPMTSGKNELQDHLIFISEKALHKRIVWSKGYSTAEQKDLVMQKKNKQ
ncbi:uncharacterized protein Gm3373 isoform X3 [Mus musculus]|nr:uncharacterized protein Gm3373 isoform X3 [Mus musculus]